MKDRLREIYEEIIQEAEDELVSPTFLAAQRIFELEQDEARLDWFSAAQLRYVTECYPEGVTKEEAKNDEDWKKLNQDQKDFWELGVKVLRRMAKANTEVSHD